MKKKLLAILIVLVMIVSLVPAAASAGWSGWVSCMVGEHVYYYIGSIDYAATYSTNSMPAGLAIAEQLGSMGRELYISGYPQVAGSYTVYVYSTDGQTLSCQVEVDSTSPVGPVTAPPYVSWTSKSVRCSQNESVYVSVGVENSGGWDLYYTWYKNGNQMYGANGASFYCDTSSARKDVYQCKIDAYKGNGNVTLWSNEVWVDVIGNYVSAINVYSLPYKTTYFDNERLDTNGLGLTVTYNTGYQEKIYKGFTCSPTTFSKLGTQKITVSYGGCSTSFNVEVKQSVKVSSISLDSSPDKVKYFIGESLEPKGLGVLCKYTNGGEEYIYSGLSCSPTVFTKAGTETVTVTYGGKTCTFTVEVNDAYTSVDMGVVTPPTKTEYMVGDTLDLTGLTLYVDYMGGDREFIDSDNPYITIEPRKLDQPGQQKITITLMEESHLTCDFTVNVKAEEEALTETEEPAATAAPAEVTPVPETTAAPAKAEEKTPGGMSPVMLGVIGVLALLVIVLLVCVISLQKQNKRREEELLRREEEKPSYKGKH